MAILKPTWMDPRGVFGNPNGPTTRWEDNPYTSPEAFVQFVQNEMRQTREKMDELTHELMHLKGFYAWLMHAYPDTIVQYKAIQELQRATMETTAGEKASVPMYAFGNTP